ncbi:hypothetical protein [Oricola thermophila]|uniref:Uncharacterized protein n=1 Tax=Oricola thermophila TaxID=2742145 RepID=A0A6N1VCB3_9HYPH|nr:hypothetical protein [Oricola thermophila]QKV18308.1 hypothetical protein HTY61_07500 [Oricola thermophila]
MFVRFCLAFAALAMAPWPTAAQSLNPGYRLVLEPGELTVTLDGEVVFEVSQDPADPLFMVRGVRDMTGNGHANLAVIWRRARSAAQFVLAEMRPGDFAILHRAQGMTSDILSTYEALSDEQAAALARGESLAPGPELRRPLPADVAPVEPETGHWSFQPGSWDSGAAGFLGWVAEEDAEDNFSQIWFRCPDNGDPIWVLPDREHDNVEDVPAHVSLVADGMEMPIHMMPQIDDQTGAWYPIGTLDRDTDLFARLLSAGSVALAYGEEWIPLVRNGPSPRNEAALRMFIARCDLPTGK